MDTPFITSKELYMNRTPLVRVSKEPSGNMFGALVIGTIGTIGTRVDRASWIKVS